MRKIGLKEVEDIALGASLLGAGGGGDPYYGKLMAIGAIKERGPVDLISPDEVPDDAVIMPIAMMGAPTVLCEKGTGGNEYQVIYDIVSQYLGKSVYAVMPMEAGGVNSMLPIAAAARLGLPMVDCDGMGRAFPELQMVTFTIGGVSATPMALTDEKGNSAIFNTITNKWTEELARAVTMSCGGSVTVALYIMTGAIMKAYGVKDIVTRSEMLGRAIRSVKDQPELSPEDAFLKASEGYRLFRGKIVDVLRETNGAFNLGHVLLEGIGDFKGQKAEISFQNENLAAVVNGEIRATVPDLICLVDTETFTPVTTEALKYGKRVLVGHVGITDLHPGTDALVSLRGPQELCFDTIECPNLLKKFDEQIFAVYKIVYDRLYEKIAALGNGTSYWMEQWSDRRHYVVGSDFSCMLSPSAYEELVAPGIERETGFLEQSIYHLDGPQALRHLDRILQFKNLNAVQWVYGAGQPSPKHWIDVLKKIQAAGKCIDISGPPEDLVEIMKYIEPEGMLYHCRCRSEEEAKALIKAVTL